ncbi:MAG TPA: hypothetical protein P5121_27050, partial [Caldilineaceae bacterium]|nr:hypothetical protein [Caldilineaceae bacterium]
MKLRLPFHRRMFRQCRQLPYGSVLLLLLLLLPLPATAAPPSPYLVADINQSAGTESAEISRLITLDGVAYFVACDYVHGCELWKSDGTTGGTQLVKDIYPGDRNSAIDGLTVYAGSLYFAATDGVKGSELWRSDGTSKGTKRLRDIQPGPNGSAPFGFVEMNGNLYFHADNGKQGRELWVTNGRTNGTHMVKDVRPGKASSEPRNLVAIGDKLYFIADDGVHGRELWRSNGTAGGTRFVKDIYPGVGRPQARYLTKAGDRLLFSANDGHHGQELWVSDGSTDGTLLLKDIWPGTMSSDPEIFVMHGAGNDTVYFVANDGEHGYELWRSDGTTANTVLVKNIFPDSFPYYDDAPEELIMVNDTLFFKANDGVHGDELWASDGSEGGTRLVKDIYPGPWSSIIDNFTTANGRLYFFSNDEGFYSLWQSDGTEIGTVPFVTAALNSLTFVDQLTTTGDKFFFAGDDRIYSRELWVSSGTDSSTQLLKDINNLGHSSNAWSEFGVDDIVYFTADDGVHGRELWKHTSAGAAMVTEMHPGPDNYFSSTF